MKIIFLHGLESTPETSSSAKLIKDNFETVYVPDYHPTDSYTEIRDFLTEYVEDEDIVIGISIGGFWALHMTEFTNVKKVILINPAIVRSCSRYNVELNTPVEVTGQLLLNMDDEIVDNYENELIYRNRFSVVTFEEGGHRASNKEEILEEIKKSVNLLGVWIP